MDRFKHFQKFQAWYVVGVLTLFFLVNALTLATSRIMEEVASGSEELPFETWEPFLWEISSAVTILLLVVPIKKLLDLGLLTWQKPVRSGFGLLAASLVFSFCHVIAMVMIRELVYWFAGSNYEFGSVVFGLIYEYRKDLLTFVIIVAVIYSYRFIVARLNGEASLIEYLGNKPKSTDRILIKKLGKEFIVKVDDVDWLEASGNYVNLHVGERIYPTRNTISALIATIEHKGFCRIQRSFGVNLDRIESIQILDSGSAELTLLDGTVLPVSRRYKECLKTQLEETAL